MSPKWRSGQPREQPLTPGDFARRVATKFGTRYGRLLLAQARASIEQSGDVDPWIREIRQARDDDRIARPLAHFLMCKLVEAFVSWAVDHDDEIIDIFRRIDDVKRAHGLAEDDEWLVHEAPLEYQQLNHAFEERVAEMTTALFRRTGAPELATLKFPEDDPLFEEGRRLFVGRSVDYGGDDE